MPTTADKMTELAVDGSLTPLGFAANVNVRALTRNLTTYLMVLSTSANVL
jgi:hypothetical protein